MNWRVRTTATASPSPFTTGRDTRFDQPPSCWTAARLSGAAGNGLIAIAYAILTC